MSILSVGLSYNRETKIMAIELMDGKKIDAGIASIAKRSAKLSADIHTYGVQALLHALTHSDPRKVDAILKALHKANRPEAFKVWVEANSPIRWNGDGKIGMQKPDAKAFTPFNIDGANAKPYYEATENVGKPLTLAALKAMIQQMEKKLDKAEKDDLIAEGENVVEMKAFVARAQQLIAA